MKKRDFNAWLNTRTSDVATFTYFTDFAKVYNHLDSIKIELNILNSLIGSQSIEEDFRSIVERYPEVLKAVPILLAKRDMEIHINDAKGEYFFNFIKMNYSVDQYVLFMENTGLFELLSKHIIGNLCDYVLGVEVGLDSNARKNRTGDIMEDLVESYLQDAGLIKGKTYFKEMSNPEVESRFGCDLSTVGNRGKKGKRWDFVFQGALGDVFLCECNFYNGGGSKLNETSRSYKELATEVKNIPHVHFVWFTDGLGWDGARNNLQDTFEVLDTLYDINDLKNGAVKTLVNNVDYVKALLENK